MDRCRFVSSWGGVARCGDPAYREGFCGFHYDCDLRGEIDDRGIISERLDDQGRRRTINFHALRGASARAA